MYYVSSPYTDKDPAVTERRMKIVCEIVIKLMNQGKFIATPLMNHLLTKYGKLPGDYEYWIKYSEHFVPLCTEGMFVICQDTWVYSEGVMAEIRLAMKLNIPITYLDIDGNPRALSDVFTLSSRALSDVFTLSR